MSDPIIEPPGLPPLLEDERSTTPGVPKVESTWDTLARHIAADSVYRYDSRVRVRWVRWAVLSWHCGRPMRIGRIEHQRREATFGWQRAPSKVAGCGRCGYFKDVLL